MWVECLPHNGCLLFTHLLCFLLQGLNVNSDVKEPWACGRRKGPSKTLHVSYCGLACTHTKHTIALSPWKRPVLDPEMASDLVLYFSRRIQTELLDLTPASVWTSDGPFFPTYCHLILSISGGDRFSLRLKAIQLVDEEGTHVEFMGLSITQTKTFLLSPLPMGIIPRHCLCGAWHLLIHLGPPPSLCVSTKCPPSLRT